MSGWITGVAIITTVHDGRRFGIVCNSLTSVSLDPILVSWCIDHNAGSFPHWVATQEWAVHVLRSDQEALVRRFLAKGVDRFAGLEFTESEHGLPLLADVASVFIARTTARHDAGDHVILVGEVTSYQDHIATPLTFIRGKFRPGPTP
jgi:3-hydroxy-9,10-secoandrosta-1,3,5(10)-triene-9,17-dione monooxygenase reductase component